MTLGGERDVEAWGAAWQKTNVYIFTKPALH